MTDKSNVVDNAFRKGSGIEILKAVRILMKKGISTDEMEDMAMTLLRNMKEDVDKKGNLDDNYKILFHLVLSYYMFGSAIRVYEEWIKEVAAEHNMKPEKYIKVMFG